MLRLQRDPTYTGLNKFLVNHCWFDWVGVGERAWNLWISCILWTLLSLKKPRQLLNPKWRTNPPPQNCRRCKRKRNWAKSQTRECPWFSLQPFWLFLWLSCWPLSCLFDGKNQGPLEASKNEPLGFGPYLWKHVWPNYQGTLSWLSVWFGLT